MFTISGKKEKGKDIFVKYLLEAMLLPAFGDTDLYILDDMTRRWADYNFIRTQLYMTIQQDLSGPFLMRSISGCRADMKILHRDRKRIG